VELGLAEDTIVVWTSDNGADPNFRTPAMDPDPVGGQWKDARDLGRYSFQNRQMSHSSTWG
jgi:arylsulfatase A-like enzyme